MFEEMKKERPLFFFEKIAEIPHGSGNTKAISDFIVSFAKENGLSYVLDAKNNVIIYKDAYEGYEEAGTVILQGHTDMVCEKETDCDIDFLKDGLSLIFEDKEYDGKIRKILRAEGTSLGADDGVAVCYMMALLEDKNLKSPALECVFTVDEEVGMLGAAELDLSLLKGRTMINIDNGEEGFFLAGCAGGTTAVCRIPVVRRKFECKSEGLEVFLIRIEGLTGGHSGEEIKKQRANSNVLLGRVLYRMSKRTELKLVSLRGGLKDNAIPRSSYATILLPSDKSDDACEELCKLKEVIASEYSTTDPELNIIIERLEGLSTDEINSRFCPMTEDSQRKVIAALYNLPGGIQKMSVDIEDLVQTSLNMGILSTKDDEVIYSFSVRSSIASEKEELKRRLECMTELCGGSVSYSGDYPAWEYRKESVLQTKMIQVYEEMYGQTPQIGTIHAGLECGIFFDGLEGLDCVSIGPAMHDIHTPQETLELESFSRCYEYIRSVLERIK